VAMQLAAHEARLGHGKLARELRDLIDEARAKKSACEDGLPSSPEWERPSPAWPDRQPRTQKPSRTWSNS